MVYILPFVSALTTTTFLATSGVLWYNFLRAWKGDPGVIVATPDVQMKTIVQLAEKGSDKGIVNLIYARHRFTLPTFKSSPTPFFKFFARLE